MPPTRSTTTRPAVTEPPKTDAADSPDAAVIQIGVKLLRDGARLPARAYEGDAAFDLFSADQLTLAPLARAVVGSGVALDLPPGVAALTLPRSGLAARHGISLVNAPGLIDPGYRGEIKLILLNTDTSERFEVRAGERIAQLLVISLTRVALVLSGDLSATERGGRGFGSSGRH
jgi:dUTP pyrophosphatase